ncbi:MAG: hypothetical protein HYX36_11925 [Rhizobiales bacterium]|nr:hypothetical protein [Hyphomicrobiales bacterium]
MTTPPPSVIHNFFNGGEDATVTGMVPEGPRRATESACRQYTDSLRFALKNAGIRDIAAISSVDG